MSRMKTWRVRPLPGSILVRRDAVKGVHPVRPPGTSAGPRTGGGGPVFIGPTPDGDKEFVKIVAGKVGRRKPWFL